MNHLKYGTMAVGSPNSSERKRHLMIDALKGTEQVLSSILHIIPDGIELEQVINLLHYVNFVNMEVKQLECEEALPSFRSNY